MRMKLLTLPVVATLLLGCGAQSPKLEPLPGPKVKREKVSGGDKVTFSRAVDILFVVDDSGSMGTHQANLATNVSQFTQGIIANQSLDYHIAVTTGNMDSPGSGADYGSKGVLHGKVKYITRNTPNAAAELEKNLKPGTGGTATEVFFTPVMAALSPPLVHKENAGFYRPDATLAVIFVTDADDQSNKDAQDFYDFLLQLKGGDRDKIVAYSAFIPTAERQCNRGGEPEPKKLEDFFRLTNAKTFGLCDADFGAKLTALADDLLDRVGAAVLLPRAPIKDTIVVTFGSQIIPEDPKTGWMFDPRRNAIRFGPELNLLPEPPGTQVEVDYGVADFPD